MKPLSPKAEILEGVRFGVKGNAWWSARDSETGEWWGHAELRAKQHEPEPEPPPRDSPGWFYRGNCRVA